MTPKRFFQLMPMGLALLLAVGEVAAAQDATAQEAAESDSVGLSALLGFVNNPSLPSLDGLIRPEKMGLLTDNQLGIKDNNVQILSGIRLLSGITVNVHVTFSSGNDQEIRGKKGKGRRRMAKRKAAKKRQAK